MNQPQPGYYPPPPPQGAPQGYQYPPQQGYQQGYYPPPQGAYGAPPQAAPPQAPQPARGTLSDFLDQPSVVGGGPSLRKYFQNKGPGTWLHVRFTQPLNNTHVQQQKEYATQQLKYHGDGRPQLQLPVPFEVIASSDGSHAQAFPEGTGTWWVKDRGAEVTALKSAMSLAGVTDPKSIGIPEKGATAVIIDDGHKVVKQGYQPAWQVKVQYGRPADLPNQAQPVPVTEVSPVPSAAPAPSAIPTLAPQAPPIPAPPSFSGDQATLLSQLT